LIPRILLPCPVYVQTLLENWKPPGSGAEKYLPGCPTPDYMFGGIITPITASILSVLPSHAVCPTISEILSSTIGSPALVVLLSLPWSYTTFGSYNPDFIIPSIYILAKAILKISQELSYIRSILYLHLQ
jgi:hypothetical protein